MLKRPLSLLFLAGVVTCAGCGKPPVTATSTLSVEAWKSMPIDRKYTAETFERLKEGDPKLQTDEGWRMFNRTTLAVARKKDYHKPVR